MKAAKIKNLMLLGVVLMAMSLATNGQSTTDTQKSGSARHHKTANSQHYSNTQQVTNSGNNINDAGSPAEVRSERTGSLCPGNVSNVGPDRYKPENATPVKQKKQ